MRIVIKEAGYLLSYIYSELELSGNVYPIFCQISKEGIKRTKEFHFSSLEESIPQVIKLVEENKSSSIGACAIFPVETRNHKKAKLETAIMTIIKIDNTVLHILQKYKLNSENKIELKPYKVIYSENIDKNELKDLEKYYINGILSCEEGREIWLRSFK